MIARPNLLAHQDLPRAPRQRRSREKRDQLKAAALALFAEQGYEATSIDDIADRAHLAIGTVYQHVRSKRQLMLSLMDELLEHLSQLDLQPKASSDRRTALRGVFAHAMAGDRQYVGAYRAWHEAALTDADLAHQEADIHAWTTARLLHVLHFLAKLPHARPGADLPGLALVLDGLFWSVIGQASRASDLERERWIDAATHLMYHALFMDPPRRAVRSIRSPKR